MASPDSSQDLRNCAIALCGILVAGSLCSLYPLPATDYLLYGAATTAAILAVAAIGLRDFRHWGLLALLICAYTLTYIVVFWKPHPSGGRHLFYAWLNLGSGGGRQFWNEVLVPALFVALAVTGLATLPGLPRFRSAVLWSIFATAFIAVAIISIDEVESRAAEARRAHNTAVRMAAVHFVRAGVTDRKPDRKWVSLVESLDPPVWEGPSQSVFRLSTVGNTSQILGPKAPSLAVLPLGLFDNTEKTQMTSDLVYFARGYDALRRGDFPAAKGAFIEASSLYDFSNENMRYMLAYYAYAAANSGHTSAVEMVLDRMKNPEHQRFDYHLARGVLAGLGGKHDDAVRALQLALHWRPLTDGRPLHSEHQYAEIVEWIFESTRKAKYRDLMLAWARANQELSPRYAWPHAMIAKHSRDSQERRSAVAAAHYLDPNSERLSTVDKMELEAASRDFTGINPLLKVRLSKEESI